VRYRSLLPRPPLLAGSHDSREERRSHSRRKRKESITNGLIVEECVPPDQHPFESTEGDEDSSPSGAAVEALQPPAPPINSFPTSCAMRSEDCESLAGEDEMVVGCAICLNHFKPQQLVCESNNPLCRHIFHKDCMVDWLTKLHVDCPTCRESIFYRRPSSTLERGMGHNAMFSKTLECTKTKDNIIICHKVQELYSIPMQYLVASQTQVL
jgi:hypothetical protein